MSYRERGTGREMVDVAVGSGLVVAGPEIAKGVFESLNTATGSDIAFSPDNEFLNHLVQGGYDTALGVTGVVATGMIIYAGLKKMFSGFENKHAK